MENSSFDDPLKKFTDRVDDYAKNRPTYPTSILTYFLEQKIIACNTIVADIGSGTGHFTKLLVKIADRIYGVEPNQAMRQKAVDLLTPYPNSIILNGSAEQTGLDYQSIDIITIAQAFHWFDIQGIQKEFARILKPQGWIIILWNERNKEDDPFGIAYDQLLLRECPKYLNSPHRSLNREKIREFFQTDSINYKMFHHEQILSLEGFLGRSFSSSYTPKKQNPKYPAFVAKLENLFWNYAKNNKVTFNYTTHVYYGQLTQ
jgi:ubiquinone/menaquinone biosynthesis C-methylase UbiE